MPHEHRTTPLEQVDEGIAQAGDGLLSLSLSLSETISTDSALSTRASSFSSLSSLSHAILPHKHKHHHSHHSRRLPVPTTPVALAELALQSVLTIPGPPIEELRDEIMPQLFHADYLHRANTREVGQEGLLDVVRHFRSRFRTVRIRFKSNLMDQDGTATMERSAVGLVYDIVAVPLTKHKRDAEELRVQCLGVVKIWDGKLAQSDIVVDTQPFKAEDGKELSCSIM